MRIALLGNLASIHLIRWINALAARRHQLHVFSSHTGVESIDGSVELAKLPVPAPAGYFLNVLYLRRELKKVEPDLLHVHFASGYGTLGTLSRFHPRLLSVWGSDVYLFPQRSPLHRLLLRTNLNSADLLSSTSEAMARLTEDLGGRDLFVVPFGIDTDRFRPEFSEASGDQVTIGTARTLADRYGLDLLLRAFADLVERVQQSARGPSLRLLIIGDGPERNRLEQLASELNLHDRVEFAGWVAHDSMPAALHRMDIFVAPSRSESFGVAVLEASACGLPVVVSDVGGLPEVVIDDRTGIVVEVGDVAALTNALARLAQDAVLRRTMGRAGRQRVIDRYQWQTCIDKMEALYQRVVDGDSG